MSKNGMGQNEKLFLNKIAGYSTLAGAALLLSPSVAQGDIVHVDPADITISDNGSYELDMDNNGAYEFIFSHRSSGGGTYNVNTSLWAYPDNASNVKYSIFIDKLSSSISLNSSLNWNNSTGELARLQFINNSVGTSSSGPWAGGADEQFIGVKFNISGSRHYGWIRVSVHMEPYNSFITIHDWAYEDDAGVTLKTGQTTNDSPTPIELSSFSAKEVSGAVRLNWQTASETENNGFIIQRKEAGGSWEKVTDYLSDPDLTGQGTITESTSYSWNDNNVQSGCSYQYRLGDVDLANTIVWHDAVEIAVSGGSENMPGEFGLRSAFPNPFNPTLTIKYDLSEGAQTSVRILDLNGKPVATLENGFQKAGNYEVKWDAAYHASGIYLVEVFSGEKRDLKKVLLTK